jgi:hypothetical protein
LRLEYLRGAVERGSVWQIERRKMFAQPLLVELLSPRAPRDARPRDGKVEKDEKIS